MKCIVFLSSFLFKVLFYLKAFFSLDDKSIKITMYNFKNCTDFVLYKKKKKNSNLAQFRSFFYLLILS